MKVLFRIKNKINQILNNLYVVYLRIFMGYKIGNNCFIDIKTSFTGLYGNVSIGNNCIIEPNVRFKSNKNNEKRETVIENESNVFVGYGSIIDATCHVKIMSDTMIGPYVYITDANYVLKDKDIPIAKQSAIYKSTIIEKNVWIGSQCQILMGVRIGGNSNVAANSTVTKNMNENSLVTGISACVKKQLF